MAAEVVYLSTIGVTVKIGDHTIAGAYSFGDIGADPERLDATVLTDRFRRYLAGVQDYDTFAVDFRFENSSTTSDFRALKALEKKGGNHDVEIGFPDGTKFKSTAQLSIMAQGGGVNEVLNARANCFLQSEWEVTDPTA